MWRHSRNTLINHTWRDNRISAGQLLLYRIGANLHVGIVDTGRRRKDGWSYTIGRGDRIWMGNYGPPYNLDIVRDYRIREGIYRRVLLSFVSREVHQSQVVAVWRKGGAGRMWKAHVQEGAVMGVHTWVTNRGKRVISTVSNMVHANSMYGCSFTMDSIDAALHVNSIDVVYATDCRMPTLPCTPEEWWSAAGIGILDDEEVRRIHSEDTG